MIIRIAFFALVLIGFVSGKPKKLPEEIQRCKRNDPELDLCLKKAIQASVPVIFKGIPNLGLFPLDPLKITALDIAQGSGPVSIDLKFRDFTLYGLTDVRIDQVRTDLNNYMLEIQGSFKDPLKIESQYEANGSILFLPLSGKGDCHLSLDDLKATINLKGEELIKDGQSYMDLKNFTIDLETSRLHMKFMSLISNNEDLGNSINEFLNENWKDIFRELYPAIKEAIGSAFKEIATRLLSKVPYDDIFLK